MLWQWEQQTLIPSEIATLNLLQSKLENETGEALSHLITTEEVSALKERVARLQTTKVFPSPSPDWPAVPWPPF